MMALGTLDDTTVTNEMVAAFSVFVRNMNKQIIMHISNDNQMLLDTAFMESVKKYMQVLQGNLPKGRAIAAIAQDMMKDYGRKTLVNVGVPTFDVAVQGPEGSHGKWIAVVAPVIVDENYKAKIIDTLDFDMYFVASVTPPSDLSANFNAVTKIIRAGQKFEPFVITHETKPNVLQSILKIDAQMFRNSKFVGTMAFSPISLAKWGEPKMDMGEILDAVGYKPDQP